MFPSRPAIVFAQSIEARCYVRNEDVVGAGPTGDASATYEWSTILLPKVRLILEVWRYFKLTEQLESGCYRRTWFRKFEFEMRYCEKLLLLIEIN